VVSLALALGVCPTTFAANTEYTALPMEVTECANEISQEDYITAMACEKGISYEDAEKLDAEQSHNSSI
jgi:hypothetical protein